MRRLTNLPRDSIPPLGSTPEIMAERDIIQHSIIAVEHWIDEANSWFSVDGKLLIDLEYQFVLNLDREISYQSQNRSKDRSSQTSAKVSAPVGR